MTSSIYEGEGEQKVETVARILFSFHNEIENKNENTKTIFKNNTNLYSTSSIS